MKRTLTAAAAVLAATVLAGCSAPVAKTPTATKTAGSVSSATGAMTRALASCGLFPDDDGVTMSGTAGLTLASQPHGEPTDVVAATARCTLVSLGLPSKQVSLFDATTMSGGYQTLQWGRYSATVDADDTLRFTVDVFAAG